MNPILILKNNLKQLELQKEHMEGLIAPSKYDINIPIPKGLLGGFDTPEEFIGYLKNEIASAKVLISQANIANNSKYGKFGKIDY